jgi:hypothetical protein
MSFTLATQQTRSISKTVVHDAAAVVAGLGPHAAAQE